MSATKVHKLLKKYRHKYKLHKESWQKDHVPKISAPGTASHRAECHAYAEKGNRLLREMMEEFEGVEVFPKNKNNGKTKN